MKLYFETQLGKLYHGDCLEIMPQLDITIDMIMTDPPYGVTQCEWDVMIPLDLMWKELTRLIKSSGAIVITASQPFTTKLISSNIEMFKYDWIWNKIQKTGHLNATNRPMIQHESILVYYKEQCIYNRQFTKRSVKDRRPNRKYYNHPTEEKNIYGEFIKYGNLDYDDSKRNPSSILEINMGNPWDRKNNIPTQKPIALMEYLIKTYTNKNDVVLDFTIGSGTTAIACERLNRRWIGIEISKEYCDIAVDRIKKETAQYKLDLV